MHIDFDRYTFRHFDAASNEWKTETGEWTLMVGDNAEHLPLTIPHTVAGDVNPIAADTALGHYLSGHVKEVTDAEMAVLFGHEVVAPGKPVTFGVNDPIMSWVDSKGFVHVPSPRRSPSRKPRFVRRPALRTSTPCSS